MSRSLPTKPRPLRSSPAGLIWLDLGPVRAVSVAFLHAGSWVRVQPRSKPCCPSAADRAQAFPRAAYPEPWAACWEAEDPRPAWGPPGGPKPSSLRRVPRERLWLDFPGLLCIQVTSGSSTGHSWLCLVKTSSRKAEAGKGSGRLLPTPLRPLLLRGCPEVIP